jgi:hypothetical protein
MMPGRAAFSQKLLVEGTDTVCLYLRDGIQVVQRSQGEAVLDLNHSGNWVRGFEMVGGFVPFSIAKAVSPFHPMRPAFPSVLKPGTVTYDPEADAAFVYLEYDVGLSLVTPDRRAELSAVWRSVNPMATYGLDNRGGLVWVRVPIADLSGSVDRFLELLRK